MSAEKRAHRYAVLSGKGGVGKTLIAANVAAALSSAGVRTALFDADLGLANVDVILGLNPALTLPDLLRGHCTLDQVLVRAPGGFDLVPAGSGILEGTHMTAAMAENLESLIRDLDQRYDAVLFDVGAGIGEVVVFFARMADTVLLVVTPEPTSLTDAYATIKVLAQRYGLRDFSLIVNQAGSTRPEQTAAEIAGRLRGVTSRFLAAGGRTPVRLELAGVIPTDPAVLRAVGRQQLLVEADPEAPATRSIFRIAGALHPMAPAAPVLLR